MRSPVDWDLAERVAVRVAGHEPLADSYHYARLAIDFVEVTAQAEALVERATGLRSASGPARARVVDRADWVRANLASFGRLLRPLTDKMAERMDDGGGARALMSGFSRRAAALEVGALLGWMGTRVLGQYDLLIIEDEDPEDQDIVYYVGPNVLALEKRYGFPPASSACGWRCTRSPTAPSSPGSRGCGRTSCRWSTRRSTPSTPTPSGSWTR